MPGDRSVDDALLDTWTAEVAAAAGRRRRDQARDDAAGDVRILVIYTQFRRKVTQIGFRRALAFSVRKAGRVIRPR